MIINLRKKFSFNLDFDVSQVIKRIFEGGKKSHDVLIDLMEWEEVDWRIKM